MLFNASSEKTTDDILDWNELCAASIRREGNEAQRRLLSGEAMPSYLLKQLSLGCTQAEMSQHFVECQAEIGLSSILNIVACTESRIRFDATRRVNKRSDDLGKALALKFGKASQNWKVPFRDGILDAWKVYARNCISPSPMVDKCVQSIGDFGRPLDTRHWVAHGRYWNLRWRVDDSAVANAATASEKLIESLQQLAQLGGIATFA